MKASFRELWWLNGSVDRGTYAVVGALAFAVKHNLDRIIATYIFHRPWGMFNYWVPLSNAVRIMQLSHNDAIFLTTMLAIALPFVWLGVAMTLKRLRGAGLPNSLVVLFFAPFLNLGFFLLLCVWPERGFTAMTRGASRLAAVIPSSTWGSAAFSFLFTIPFGLVSVLFATRVLTTYGWSLFVALPFTLGMAAALVHGVHQPRTLPACIAIACLSNAILGLGLLALAWEGVICLAMAAPIAIVLASFGGACGYLIQRRRWRETPIFASVLFAFVPGLQWFEHALATPCPVLVVRSVIEIQAPPEEVWRQVTSFSEIPPPTDFIFRVGVAYPIRAEILGNGPGAERHCVFSTGQFVEPIEIWDEPHRLKFSVKSNPPPMQEWTPYSHVDPPHLHGFLVSSGGQFLLTPLPNGGTRLEGTTWYRHGLWPVPYWQLWSDAIIHRIHMRVLRHIRDESEHPASSK